MPITVRGLTQRTASRVQVTSIDVGALVGLLEETVSTWDEIPVQG